jgi:hypothetical protein
MMPIFGQAHDRGGREFAAIFGTKRADDLPELFVAVGHVTAVKLAAIYTLGGAGRLRSMA